MAERPGNKRKKRKREKWGLFVTPPFEITHGLTLLLCGKEGWQTTTDTRLPVHQLRNHTQQVPPTTNSRTHRPPKNQEVFYQTRCTMGIQQHPHQGSRRMEGRLQNKQ